MRHLQDLNIANTNVTDKGMRHLRLFPDLKKLMVGGERITDQGIAELASLTGLIDLDIETRFTDRQLPAGARATIVSEKVVNSLRRTLPNCSIYFHTDYY